MKRGYSVTGAVLFVVVVALARDVKGTTGDGFTHCVMKPVILYASYCSESYSTSILVSPLRVSTVCSLLFPRSSDVCSSVK